jgi:TatD DNase family protein
MDLTDIILETDCPYLTPVPHRGERNESSYVRFICAKVAELKDVDYQLVADQATANAKRIFKL